MYRIVLYSPEGKPSPIKKFLDSCQLGLRIKILRQLKYVEEYGLNPAIPNIRKITRTPLWELRLLGRDNVRIFCVSSGKREVRVLHIFRKKKRKMPVKELNLALRRYQEVVD